MRRQLEQLVAEQPCCYPGERDTNGDTTEHEERNFPENHEQDASSLRAQRHTNADLCGPSRYRVADGAVQSYAGQWGVQSQFVTRIPCYVPCRGVSPQWKIVGSR